MSRRIAESFDSAELAIKSSALLFESAIHALRRGEDCFELAEAADEPVIGVNPFQGRNVVGSSPIVEQLVRPLKDRQARPYIPQLTVKRVRRRTCGPKNSTAARA